jgi:hypothetical protein
MKKMIHHIRRQPEEERRHLLHLLIILAGIILFFLWIYSLGTNFTPAAQAKIKNDLKPFSALKDNLIGGYKSISQPDLSTQENNL